MANDSFNLFVSSFVSFSVNGLKENAENLNYYSILRRKVELYLFLQRFQPSRFDVLPPALPIFTKFSRFIIKFWKLGKNC